MGTDISFLLERNRGDGWESPVDLLPQFPNAFQRSTVVEVCWWPARRALTDLFFGDTALIPFNSGLPEDLSPEVYDYCQLNFQDNDRLTGWLPISELMLSDWDTSTVIVADKCPARHALMFWDGCMPHQTLLATVDEMKSPESIREELRWLINGGKLVETAFDLRPMKEKLVKFPDNYLLDVSWSQPISFFANAIFSELQVADKLLSDSNFRIVTAIG